MYLGKNVKNDKDWKQTDKLKSCLASKNISDHRPNYKHKTKQVQKLLSELYYRQLSADIKIKKIFYLASFVSQRLGQSGINFTISILLFMENCLYYNVIHDFSVLLITGSNPTDMKRFRSHTGNYFLLPIPRFMYNNLNVKSFFARILVLQ